MRIYSDSFYYHCTLHQSDRTLPYLLMLHGFMGSEKVFDHLMDDLKMFCNPITIDLAGHGQTKSPEDPDFYSAGRQVNQLYSIIQRFHLENLYLYGYSMGGRLAFQMIASHPDLFSGVIVESSHCGIQSDEEKEDRKKADEKRAQKIESNFDEFIEEWSSMPLFKYTPLNMQMIYKEVMQQQKPKYMSASLRGFGAGVMPVVYNEVSKTSIPLTLIAGEYDQKYVDRMRAIKNEYDLARFHVINKAGHRVHADQPDQLTEILKDAISCI